jgi:hypothetical protein
MHESSLHCRWRARGPCGDGSTDCRNGSGGNPRSHGDAYIGGQRIAVRSARRVLATGDVLHGGPDFDMSYLLPELDRLANSYRLIYHDQWGHGWSADGVRAEDVKLGSTISSKCGDAFGWTRSPGQAAEAPHSDTGHRRRPRFHPVGYCQSYRGGTAGREARYHEELRPLRVLRVPRTSGERSTISAPSRAPHLA